MLPGQIITEGYDWLVQVPVTVFNEAFAQLGTELDAASQLQLDRGARMVELLKQGQYRPRHVTDQVLSIFAGTRGFLDDLPLSQVGQWEEEFLQFMRDQNNEIVEELNQTQDLTDELVAKITAAIEAFQANFAAVNQSTSAKSAS